MDIWRYLIYGFLAVLLTIFIAGCITGCGMTGSKKGPATLAEDLAENCESGMLEAEIDFDNDGEQLDKVRVLCASGAK